MGDSVIPDIPLQYLFECSGAILGEYEISRLNRAANLKKELRAMLEKIVDNLVQAEFARWMLEHREELCGMAVSLEVGEKPLDLGGGQQREGIAEADATHGPRADAAD